MPRLFFRWWHLAATRHAAEPVVGRCQRVSREEEASAGRAEAAQHMVVKAVVAAASAAQEVRAHTAAEAV